MWIPPELLVSIFKNIKDRNDLVNTCRSQPFWMAVINMHIWCKYKVSTLHQIISLQHNRCMLILSKLEGLNLYKSLSHEFQTKYNFKFSLDLSHTNVTDVSALGNVHTLDLRGTKVTDVSALGNVKILYR